MFSRVSLSSRPCPATAAISAPSTAALTAMGTSFQAGQKTSERITFVAKFAAAATSPLGEE